MVLGGFKLYFPMFKAYFFCRNKRIALIKNAFYGVFTAAFCRFFCPKSKIAALKRSKWL